MQSLRTHLCREQPMPQNTFCGRGSRVSRRIISCLLIATFINLQIVWAEGIPLTSQTTPQPETSPQTQSTSPAPTSPAPTSLQFLSTTSPLQPAEIEKKVSYDTSGTLKASNITTLPGNPRPYLMAGSNLEAKISSPSSDRFQLDYRVLQSSAVSGFTISFDDAGTTTIETRSLSSLTNLIVGLQGNASSVKLSFTDGNGNKDTFVLTGVSQTVENFWKIPLSMLASTVDKNKIRQIDFYVDSSTGLASSGNVLIRIKDLQTTPSKPTVASVPSTTTQSMLTLSGTKEADTAVIINGIEMVARNRSTTWSATAQLTAEGNNSFKIQTKNVLGKLSATKSITVKRNATLPVGSIDINSGAVYTASPTLALNLSASDPAGIDKMSFSTDNSNWTTPETYQTSKTFTLPPGDGQKTIYVKYYNKAGVASQVYSKSIVLDTMAPTGTVVLNDAAIYASSANVTVSLSVTDTGTGVDKMRFSTDGGATWSTWENFSQTQALILPAGEGIHEIKVGAKDKVGKVSVFSDSITLDTIPPAVVLVSATRVDQPVYTFVYKVDGVEASESSPVSLHDGENVIERTFRDEAGNATQVTWTIVYHQVNPIPLERVIVNSAFSYTATGETEKAQLADGQIHYNPATFDLEILDAGGNIVRKLEVPVRVPPEGTNLLSVSLEGGTKVFYENGQIQHLIFQDGSFVQNVVLDSEGKIKEAVIFSADGRILLVAGGVLLREISPQGVKTDYTPDGLMVREIPPQGETTFYYYEARMQKIWVRHGDWVTRYDSQARLEWVSSGTVTRKFDSGILTEISTPQGVVTYSLNEETLSDGKKIFKIEAQNPDPLNPEIQIRRAIFDDQRNPLSMTLMDGTQLTFTDGLVTSVVDPAGKETTYDYQANQGLLLQLGVNRAGVRSEYDASGKLSKITANDTTFQIQDGKIASLDLKDGSKVLDLTLDESGNVKNATVRDPDGTYRTYENGALVRVIQPDGSIWIYADGKPRKLTTNLKLEYEFTQPGPDEFRAKLINVDIADASAPIELVYDSHLNLQWMKRKNNEVLHFQDSVLQSRTLADGGTEIYTYTRDAEGNVVKTFLSQDNVRSFFNERGEIEKTVISATLENPHTTEVIYRYGKIREILEDGTKIMNYSYEFTQAGEEITVIENLKKNQTSRYKDKLLLTALDQNTNVVTTNTYDGDKIKHAEQTRNGKILHAYDYVYEAKEIRVTDETGITRVYDGETQKLVREYAGGATYEYAYTKNPFLSEANPFVKEGTREFSLAALPDARVLGMDGLYLYVEAVGKLHRLGPNFDFVGPSGQVEAMDTAITKPDGTSVTVPQGKALAHSDQAIYFLGSSASTLQRLDLKTGEVRTISLSLNPVNETVNRTELISDGLLLYVARFVGDRIILDAIDTRQDFKTVSQKSFQVSSADIQTIAVDGTYFYALSASQAAVFRMEKQDVVRTWNLSAGFVPTGIFYDAIHNEFWVKSALGTSLYRLKGMRDSDGRETSTRELTLIGKEDGTKIHYSKGKIVEIDRPDGVRITDYVADSNGNPIYARYHYLDGSVEEIQGHISIEIPQPDFSTKTYTRGKLTKWTLVDGREIDYEYENREDGEYTLAKTGFWTYVYDAEGKLTEAVRDKKHFAASKEKDAKGNLARIVLTGEADQLFFDPNFELTEYHSLASGAKAFFQKGELVRIEEPALKADFDLGEVTKIQDALGNEVSNLVYEMNGARSDSFADPVLLANFPTASMNLTGIETFPELGTSANALRMKSGNSTYVDLVDMNGDSLLDRVVSYPAWNGIWKVQLNNGNGFNPSVNWTGIENFSQEPAHWVIRTEEEGFGERGLTVELRDMNGDGRPDRIEADPDGYPGTWKVQFNNGKGFDPAIEWGPVDNIQDLHGSARRAFGWSIELTHTDILYGKSVMLIDVNGDLLPDRVETMGRKSSDSKFESFGVYKVQINNGRGFDPPIEWGNAELIIPGSAGGSEQYFQLQYANSSGVAVDFADIDGDGLPDRIQATNDPAYGGTQWKVQFNTGEGLDTMKNWGNVQSKSAIELRDVNGDGLLDRIYFDAAASSWKVQLNASYLYLIQSGTFKLKDATTAQSMLRQATGRYQYYLRTLLPYLTEMGLLGNEIKKEDLALSPDKVNSHSKVSLAENETRAPWTVRRLTDGRAYYYEGEKLVGMKDAGGNYTGIRYEVNSKGEQEFILANPAGERRYDAQGNLIQITLPSKEKLSVSGNKITGRNGYYELGPDGKIINYESSYFAGNYDYVYENGLLKKLVQTAGQTWLFRGDTLSENQGGWLEKIIYSDATSSTIRSAPPLVFDPSRGFGAATTFFGVVTFGNPYYAQLLWQDGDFVKADLIDINGDGLLDRVIQQDGNRNYFDVQIGTGSKFLAPIRWEGVQNLGDSANGWIRRVEGGRGVRLDLFDLNGDGLPDRVLATPDQKKWKVQFNNGKGFDPFVDYGPIETPGTQESGMGTYKAYIRYHGSPDWTCSSVCGGSQNDAAAVTLMADMNGDGLLDRVMQTQEADPLYVQLNTGTGFEAAKIWAQNPEVYNYHVTNDWPRYFDVDSQALFIDMQDVTGDGKADRVLNPFGFFPNTGTHDFWMIQAGGENGLLPAYSASVTAFGSLDWGDALSQIPKMDLIDLNNDGLADRIYQPASGPALVQMNLGGKFAAPVAWTAAPHLSFAPEPLRDWRITNITEDFRDMNGDGLPDKIWLDPATNTWKVQLNKMPSQVLVYRALEATKQMKTTQFAMQKLWKDPSVTLDLSLFHPATSSVSRQSLSAYLLDPETVALAQIDESGKLLSVTKPDGMTTLYEGERAIAVLNEFGEMEIRYEYDAEGNPTQIRMETSRRRLPLEIERARKEVELKRLQALLLLADQRAFAVRDIREKVIDARKELEQVTEELSRQQAFVQSLSGKGKQIQQVKAQAMSQIAGAMSQIQTTFADLFHKEAEALAKVDSQIAAIQSQIESESGKAFADIEAQRLQVEKQILKEETSPLIFNYYRKILGRDPSQKEFDYWIAQTNFVTGLDLAFFKQTLGAGQIIFSDGTLHSYAAELQERKTSVQAIKDEVESKLIAFFNLSPELRANFLASLGLTEEDLAPLMKEEAQRILDWIKTRSLHLSQTSAYRSLAALLDQAGTLYNAEDLTAELILIDILTGVITPLDNKAYNPEASDELVISLYAMKKAAKVYGLETFALKMSFEELLAHYSEACPDANVPCSFKAVLHIDGNHYITVTKVTADTVTYFDPGAGFNEAGELVALSKTEFVKVWQGTVLSTRAPPQDVREYTQSEQQSIRGAFFFPIILAFLIFGALFSAVDLIVNGIGGIKAQITQLVSAIGSLFTGNLVGFAKNIGSFFTESLKALARSLQVIIPPLGKLALRGVEALQNLQDKFYAGIDSFVASVSDKSRFLGGLVKTAIGYGSAAERLAELTGMNPRTAAMITGIIRDVALIFVTAGGATPYVIGARIAASVAANLISTLDVNPGVRTAIQAVAIVLGASAGGFSSGDSLAQIIKTVAPLAAKQFAQAGITALGSSLGLDWRLAAFIGMPIGAALGGFVDSLGYAGHLDSMSFVAAIKNGLSAAAQSVGFDFSGKTTDALFGSLKSGDILGSVESALGREGLFSNILDVLKQTLLSPFNAVSGIVSTVLKDVTDFGSLIQSKGIAQAFESLATSIFNRQTIERLLGSGGIGGVLSTVAKVLTTLDGQSVQEQNLGGGTSLFYDLAGNFIGKKENGVTQIGTFGVTSSGQWGLLAGKLIANLIGGTVFAGEGGNGQLMSGSIFDSQGQKIVDLKGDGNNPYIVIDGRDNDSSSNQGGSFWNMVFKFLPYAMNFIFDQGQLQKADIQLPPASPSSGTSTSTKDLFVLANGVGNPQTDPTKAPDYIQNLETDLKNQSQSQQSPITDNDLLAIPLYQPTLPVLDAASSAFNKIVDSLKWVFESQLPGVRLKLTAQAMGWLKASGASQGRPLIAMGYSGGFIPLVEALGAGLITGPYNISGVLGLGAATMSLTKDILDASLAIIDFVLGKTVDAIESLLAKIKIVGEAAAKFINYVQTKAIDKAIEMLRNALSPLQKTPVPSLLPSLGSTNASFLVNLWGTKDVLYETGIAGYRSELIGFTPTSDFHKLFNIEILGATHFDYMRRGETSVDACTISATSDACWNVTVSDFVTRLLIASQSKDSLAEFLDRQIRNGIVTLDGSRYVVSLPGHS